MKSGYLLHIFAAITLFLGVYIVVTRINSESHVVNSDESQLAQNYGNSLNDSSVPPGQTMPKSNFGSLKKSGESGSGFDQLNRNALERTGKQPRSEERSPAEAIDPKGIASDYIATWQNRDIHQVDKLWKQIADCEKCLKELVDLLVNHKLEEGLDLEVAIKMATLDTDIVLPVFDALIDPSGDKTTAIILSEKLMKNGRPEFVDKMFDLIYRAKQNGYENFAQQLTWVISKLENPDGIGPILDTITGRKLTSPELSAHVTNVYSKVVRILPESSSAGEVIANYYLQANSQEQQRLWPVVRQNGKTLVTLAINADSNGQNYDVQKYAGAMAELPHLDAVTSLMQLHSNVEYSPDYLGKMLAEKVVDNPTTKVLQKLEDYMRNPDIKLESRIFAAEGLLAVKKNRQARYILEKVIKNTEEPDVELQAYIGGRL